MKMMKKRYLIILLILLLPVVAIFSTKEIGNLRKKRAYKNLSREILKNVSSFYGNAGIYIKDMKTGIVVSHNEETLFPSASLVKIPLMAAVFQAREDGLLNFEQEVVLKKKYKAAGSGILKNISSCRKFKIGKIVELMITESDNTATNIVSDLLGLDYINRVFKDKFGLSVTRLDRNIMELNLRRRGIDNYTTAKELGDFLEKLYTGKIVSTNASKEMINILSKQKKNDRIPRFLPQDLSVAHKTGFLKNVCHDAGIVFTPKGDFVVCILTSDFKSTKVAKIFIGEVAYKTYRCY